MPTARSRPLRRPGGHSMQTLALTSVYRHTSILISTERPTEFIDLTERLNTLVTEAGIRFGFVNVQSLHTTAAIVVNEHEPLLLLDFDTLLENTAPGKSNYRHDDATVRTVNLTA